MKIGSDLLKRVQEIGFVLHTKFFLLRKFVPEKERLRITKLNLFSNKSRLG